MLILPTEISFDEMLREARFERQAEQLGTRDDLAQFSALHVTNAELRQLTENQQYFVDPVTGVKFRWTDDVAEPVS